MFVCSSPFVSTRKSVICHFLPASGVSVCIYLSKNFFANSCLLVKKVCIFAMDGSSIQWTGVSPVEKGLQIFISTLFFIS